MADVKHKRAHRVAHLIQAALAQLLVEGLKDPRVGFVTVTEVRLTDDLRAAQAFVSIFGDEAKRQTTLAGLRAASGFLRRELGHSLQLRVVPDLTFVHDDSLDRAQRLQAVLSAAARGDREVPGPQEPAATLPEARTARSGFPEPPPPSAKPAARRARRGGGRRKATRSGPRHRAHRCGQVSFITGITGTIGQD